MSWRWAALVNGFKDATAYRVEFLAEVLGSAAVPAAVQLVLWYAMFQVGGLETVGGLTYAAAIKYTILSTLFSQVRGGDHDFELAEMIRSGQLSAYLLRPVGVVEFVYLRGVAPKIFLAGLGLLIGLAASPWLGVRPEHMLLGMLVALVGNVIHYLLGAALAGASFWFEESFGILMVKNMIVSILSGELIPLSLFPDHLSWLWRYTPFYLYVYGPVQVASGRWGGVELLFHAGVAAAWLGVAWLAVKGTWRIGIRHYQALGG